MSGAVLDDPELQGSLEAVSRERQRLLAIHKSTPRIPLERAAAVALDRWKAAQGRIIVGIGGCPASGKTAAAQRLTGMIVAQGRPRLAAHLPMDGYHFSNARLQELGLETVKGDRHTYDVPGYRDKLAEFKRSAGVRLTAPDYVRHIHEVVQDAITIEAETEILVTEGIYVGVPREAWQEVRPCLDLLLYLDTAPEDCVARIAARNRAAGRDEAMIRHKLRNDLRFMRTSLEILEEAEFVIQG